VSTPEELRARIAELVTEYHEVAFAPQPFVPGTSAVPVSGKVFGAEDMTALMHASLDFWLTTGRFAEQFEERFASWMGLRHASLCNSGSSANLLALSALTSPKLGERQLRPGDEVLTTAAGFPTTVNPIVQNQLVPVFVDVELGTYDAVAEQLRAAVGPRTKAIMMAHTLGNPFDLGTVMELAEAHDLWVVEDNCDALGARYDGRLTGTFGDLATVSFYPAHHITMGEGGCVLTDRGALEKLVESFRDWGRDCWCEPGCDDTCGRRFDWQLGDLPYGYDHKYTYSHVGYNLKLTDMQAAVGLSQLDKLDGFIEARKANFEHLWGRLAHLQDRLILPVATPRSDPSWFGFPITLRPEAGLSRNAVVAHLEAARIGTRLLFGGNLLRQPAYADVPHRAIGPFPGADIVTEHTFWLGVYPGLTSAMLDYVAETLEAALDAGTTAVSISRSSGSGSPDQPSA
jgi:CDP-4-dehydro-6-deoxyglucose reductase, E1